MREDKKFKLANRYVDVAPTFFTFTCALREKVAYSSRMVKGVDCSVNYWNRSPSIRFLFRWHEKYVQVSLHYLLMSFSFRCNHTWSTLTDSRWFSFSRSLFVPPAMRLHWASLNDVRCKENDFQYTGYVLLAQLGVNSLQQSKQQQQQPGAAIKPDSIPIKWLTPIRPLELIT
jgi:hypothetical protein